MRTFTVSSHDVPAPKWPLGGPQFDAIKNVKARLPDPRCSEVIVEECRRCVLTSGVLSQALSISALCAYRNENPTALIPNTVHVSAIDVDPFSYTEGDHPRVFTRYTTKERRPAKVVLNLELWVDLKGQTSAAKRSATILVDASRVAFLAIQAINAIGH